MSSKRIAYLTSFYPGVSHTFIQREIAGVRKAGIEVLPCSVRQPPASHLTGPEEQAAFEETFYVLKAARSPRALLGAQLSALARPGLFLRTCALGWKTAAPGLKAKLRQLVYYVEATLLARHLRAVGADHLHTHFASAAANVAMMAAKLAEIPFSYTLHGPADLYEPHKWALREKTAEAEFVACISFFARSQAMFFSDADHWNKLRIIHCGVQPAKYVPGTRDNAGPVRLLFVGRLAAVKGLRVLLEAFAQVQAALPDVHLTLVGDGEDRAHLEALAAPFGEAVHFAGYQSQAAVAEAMSSADIFVLPSFAEGVPVVLMEAMASQTPVITSVVAGIPELVEDGKSGHLVPPGDVETLAARIVSLAQDPQLRARMGAHGRARVVAEFDIEIEAARIARLFQDGPGPDIRPAPLSLPEA
ncbi:MAG: glycosyltransferase family 4 protein [Phaeobacter italicus]